MNDNTIPQENGKGVRLTYEKNLAFITLCRPEKGNALDGELLDHVRQLFEETDQNPDVRAVILQAEGKNFCTGADLSWMLASEGRDMEKESIRLAHLMKAVATCSKPTFALVQGSVYGGGIGLTAACDFAIASKDAIFAFREVRLGLVPATISPYIIRKIGPMKTMQFMLTGRRFSAAEAAQIGLIDDIARTAPPIEKAMQIIEKLAMGGSEAQHSIKQMINHLYPLPDETTIKYTASVLARARSSAETAEGIKAFFEKRKPDWSKLKP